MNDTVRPRLYVEGINDKWPLINILIRRGLDYDNKPWPPQYPEIEMVGDVEELLKVVRTAIPVAGGQAIGLVFDANDDPVKRWQQIRGRLQSVDVSAPNQQPSVGFIGSSGRARTWSAISKRLLRA